LSINSGNKYLILSRHLAIHQPPLIEVNLTASLPEKVEDVNDLRWRLIYVSWSGTEHYLR